MISLKSVTINNKYVNKINYYVDKKVREFIVMAFNVCSKKLESTKLNFFTDYKFYFHNKIFTKQRNAIKSNLAG